MKVDIKIEQHHITFAISLFDSAEWVRAVSIVNRTIGFADYEATGINVDSLRRNLEHNAIQLLSESAGSGGYESNEKPRFFSECKIRKWLEVATNEIVDQYCQKRSINRII